jgi:hypothetical protein
MVRVTEMLESHMGLMAVQWLNRGGGAVVAQNQNIRNTPRATQYLLKTVF